MEHIHHSSESHPTPEHDLEQVMDTLTQLRDGDFMVKRNADPDAGLPERYEDGWIIKDAYELPDGKVGVLVAQPDKGMTKRVLAETLLSWQPDPSDVEDDTLIRPHELETHAEPERLEEALGDVALEASGFEPFDEAEPYEEASDTNRLKETLGNFFENTNLQSLREQGNTIQQRSRQIIEMLEDAHRLINATLYDTDRKGSTAHSLADTLSSLRNVVGQSVATSETLNGSMHRMAETVEDLYRARLKAEQDSQERFQAKVIDEAYDEMAQDGRIIDGSLAEVAEFLKDHGKLEREIDSLARDSYGYETTLSMLRNYVQSMIDSMHGAQSRAGRIGDRIAEIEKAR